MKKFKVKVNGTDYEVEVEEISAGSAQAAAPKADSAPAAPPPATSEGGSKIVAPMQGAILDIKVGVGDSVTKGQVLLILEAMKMENEIRSPIDGKVASINVQKGASVKANDLLAIIS